MKTNKIKDTFMILGAMAAASVIAPIWILTAVLVLKDTTPFNKRYKRDQDIDDGDASDDAEPGVFDRIRAKHNLK